MSSSLESARRRARRETPGHRRDMLLVAARSCLSKKGARGFSLKNIAAEARVSISLVSHYFGSGNGVLKAVFRSVMIETLPGDYQKAETLDDALANVQELVARHFSENYYSRSSLLEWLLIYEEILLNRRTRTTLEKIESDPPPLKWSDLKYVLWHQGGSEHAKKEAYA